MEEFKLRARFVVWFVAGTGLFLWVMWIGRTILLLFFAAALCALLLNTVTNWVSTKTGLSRGAASMLIVLGAAGAVALGLWLRGEAIVEQFIKLRTDLPLAAQKLFAQVQAEPWGRWLVTRFNDKTQLNGGFAFAMSRFGGAMLTTATAAAGLLIVLMATIYFVMEPETYLNGVRLITPSRYRRLVREALASAAMQLRWWLLAKFVSMIAVGLMIFIGLWTLRIPLAGVLGAITACLTFIPNIGPILSAVPAALLGFAISPTKGLLTVSLFCVVHFVEGNFVTPLAERQIVKLPPGLTLAVQVFLGSVTGGLGIALGAPLTAAASGIVLALSRIQSQSASIEERRVAGTAAAYG